MTLSKRQTVVFGIYIAILLGTELCCLTLPRRWIDTPAVAALFGPFTSFRLHVSGGAIALIFSSAAAIPFAIKATAVSVISLLFGIFIWLSSGYLAGGWCD